VLDHRILEALVDQRLGRCINKLESWRRPATRHDKTPESYSADLHLRGSIIWLRRLRPAE
jgi:transposase